jgi:hypothetical protein
MTHSLLVSSMLLCATVAGAQGLPDGAAAAPFPAPQAAPPAQAPYLAKGLGLMVYPAKNQSPPQQAQDEHDCWMWAAQQTGVDPVTLKPDPNAAAAAKAQAAEDTQGAAVKGAAKGAAVGAVVGSVSGNAGGGAAAGAVLGAVGGRRAKKKAEAQAAAQAQAQANAAAQAQADQFKKAMSVCLSGRGYTAQ